MPVQSSYTETQLADYMKAILGEVATLIGWTTTIGNYQEAINETLIIYGVDNISDAIDVKKLRRLARREVWRAVMQATAGNYRFGSDREVYFRQQVHQQAKEQFDIATNEASPYLIEDDPFRVTVVDLVDESDPFKYVEPYVEDE